MKHAVEFWVTLIPEYHEDGTVRKVKPGKLYRKEPTDLAARLVIEVEEESFYADPQE